MKIDEDDLWRGTSGGRLSSRASRVVQLVGPVSAGGVGRPYCQQLAAPCQQQERASPPHPLRPPRGHRASVGSIPGTSGLQREAHSAAGTQQPTALPTLPSSPSPPSPPVPGRPVLWRSQQDEEVAELLRETRRTVDLAEARNRRDAEFQARLLEHLNEAAANRRQITATVADLAAAVRDTREQSVRLHEQLVVAVSFLVLMLHYQVHPPPS
ncbi:uncharacterized protein LOC144120610 [Amblyomma americanum]